MYFTDQNITQREHPMELNFEVLEMETWNMPTDGTQRADGRNRVICLFMTFTSRGIIIKMSFGQII